jgi:hypothetical protein
MAHGQTPSQDLETFQRWAITVDDELREAVDAVIALEEPDAERLCDREATLDSERSSFELANEVVEKAQAFKENPDRPAWFTPAWQMVFRVSIWATFLMDYVDDVMQDGAQPSDKQISLLGEKLFPAIEQFYRFLDALRAAGHLSRTASR